MRSIRTKEAERMFFESADYENALDNWVEERHCIECGLIFDEELPEHICSDCLTAQEAEFYDLMMGKMMGLTVERETK